MRGNFIQKILFHNFLFKMSIRNRLIYYFILSVLIPTLIISITIYIKSSNIITSKTDQLIEKNLTIAETSILQKFETADDVGILISFNPKLMEVLAADKPKNTLLIIAEITTINDILEGYCLSNLSNFTKTTLFPKIYLLDRREYKNFKVSDKVYDISEIEKEPWYREFSHGMFKVVGFNHTDTFMKSMDSIKVARKLYAVKPSETEYCGLLTIDIETDYFNDILESIKASPHSMVFIVDEKDRVILSTKNYGDRNPPLQKSWIRKHKTSRSYISWVERIHGAKMLISVKKIDQVGWKIISTAPLRELNQELTSFNQLMYLVILVAGALSLLIALLLATDIASPIRKLVSSMSDVKGGNFEINLSYKRHDEFALLIQHYKSMMEEIKELIEKLYVSELAKQKVELKAREYELEALQAQINPHFLYNTLDSVNWLALKYKAEDISIMVKSLSNFFRYSLNKGKSQITLEEEKKQIESYLMIQRIRFKERLDFTIDFAPEILKCKTIKLILQPIVENAIIHGIEKCSGEGFIAIVGTLAGNHVEIMISDNGAGANIAELNRIVTGECGSESSFGIINVNERIKQFFGNEYGLSYLPNQTGGVTALIKLPFKL